MYDIIVFGASYAAAGIAHTHKKRCLILEAGMQGDNDFYGALQFGSDYDRTPKNEAAVTLQKNFLDTNVYQRAPLIYPYLQEADVLFGIRPVSVKKTENGFVCEAYGIEGFCTFEAKKIVDTRTGDDDIEAKTFNVLMVSDKTPNFEGVEAEKTDFEGHYVLHFPVPLSQGYKEARVMVRKAVDQFSEAQQLIISAASFDYRLKEQIPEERDGISLLPSKAYPNPILAFDAGLEVTL